MDSLSYHDLFITANGIPRTSIFNLLFGIKVQCTCAGGWEVWQLLDGHDDIWKKWGGEFDLENGLILDINGYVIVDSLTPRKTND